ncbi:hemolysin family protein [Phormidium sp. CCY1219]|uniref:hemolysin family protein n=1 Tax=Phormidium sp. CCY1219 TaxID=2886104 RepID=UPI002D1F05B5|nr:hemolysin family protein [Phormidium sp. CCY1219]MEB3827305.1 hemolysin family protein [Phormidium sp. CCY1219]
MSSVSFEILVILLLILANGLFAMSEIAIVSARKARLQQWANQGNLKAQVALELANAPNRFLSTVQVGITLVGIFAGAFGGATLAEKLSLQLQQFPAISPYSGAIALLLVVVTITYLSLILGELVPKRLGLNNPERIAARVAVPMRMLSSIGAPVIHLLSASTELVLRILGAQPSEDPQVTEEEIKLLLEQGTEAGTFQEEEQAMVERVLRLDERRVSSLMTPRPDVVWLNLDSSADENRHKIINSTHTRFPVCQNVLDNVLGVAQVNDLLSSSLCGEPLDLTASLRQPLFVPENTKALKVLELFKQSGTHIALAVDEYGVIQGLVTLNDILEAIVGDLPSVNQPEDAQAVQREDGSWLLDGMVSVEKFRQLFDLPELPGEQRGNYHTLGGFVITHLGRIPTAADHFEWNSLRFEVMDMDGNRVDKILVTPIVFPHSDLLPRED